MKTWTLQDVGTHWDETEDYDDINKKTYSYYRRFVDSFALSSVKNGDYLLDVCCRTGNGTDYYAGKKKIKSVCMDVSHKMLKICSEFLKQQSVDFEIKYFDAYPLPEKDNTFDVVLSMETLEHMPDPHQFLQELYRVLKSGGELILSTPNLWWEPIHWFAAVTHIHHGEGPHKFRTRKYIIEALQKAGFKIKTEKTTILIAYGPKWLTALGDKLEKGMGKYLRRTFCLRRIFVCEK